MPKFVIYKLSDRIAQKKWAVCFEDKYGTNKKSAYETLCIGCHCNVYESWRICH